MPGSQQLVAARLRQPRRLVHFETDAMPEAVQERLAVARPGDHLARERVALAARHAPAEQLCSAMLLRFEHHRVQLDQACVAWLAKAHGAGHVRTIAAAARADVDLEDFAFADPALASAPRAGRSHWGHWRQSRESSARRHVRAGTARPLSPLRARSCPAWRADRTSARQRSSTSIATCSWASSCGVLDRRAARRSIRSTGRQARLTRAARGRS